MSLLEIVFATIGLLLAILTAFIPFFRKIYIVRPELTIEIIPDGGKSNRSGISAKNDTSKGYIDGNNAIYIFELTWNVNVKITNNSSVIAYYPKLNFLSEQLGFTYLDSLDSNAPIKENESLLLQGKYVMYEESTGKSRTEIKGLPAIFNDLKILLENKNPDKRTFFTLFTNSSTVEKNKYLRRRPVEFK